MILMVCIDDGGGMMFNHRRQSMDRVLRLRMLSTAAGHRLWMNAYSASQFGDGYTDVIIVSEDPLGSAGPEDYCFVEDQDPSGHADDIEKVIVYKWNRAYPSDVKFTLDLSGYDMESTADFAGYSHEKITEEVYVKKS